MANGKSANQAAYEAFLWLLETYDFPLQDGQTYGGSTAIPLDPAGRRDAKIKQYKMEKAMKEQVSVCREAYAVLSFMLKLPQLSRRLVQGLRSHHLQYQLF